MTLLNKGDYLLYLDSGCVMLQPAEKLIFAMEAAGQEVMAFELSGLEKHWCKRDAFIAMGCDTPDYTDTPQRAGTYILMRKSPFTVGIAREFMDIAANAGIITDAPNALGMPNYDGFISHRHDQSIWSLLTKKHGILPFRDPSQWGDRKRKKHCARDIKERSPYPTVIDSHRNRELGTWRQYWVFHHFYWIIRFVGHLSRLKNRAMKNIRF